MNPEPLTSENGAASASMNVDFTAAAPVNGIARSGPPAPPFVAPPSGSKEAAPPATVHSSPALQALLLPETRRTRYFLSTTHG